MQDILIGCHINSSVGDMNTDIINMVKSHKFKIIQVFINKNSHLLKKSLNIPLVVHASYTINIAKNWDEYSPHVSQFIDEVINAEKIGAFCIVVHLGKQLELDHTNAINNMYSLLLYVHNKTKHCGIKILIETSSGQGTEMCSNINDLAYFFRKFTTNNKIHERFGICLDTCHIFAAGYDIRNAKSVESFMRLFDDLIGITNIKLLHFNDSHSSLGEHKDRHANIGDGKIGFNGMFCIYKIFKKLRVPIIIETPDSVRDFKKFRKL